MPKKRASHTKRIAAIFSAAIISFIGPLFSFNAYAEVDGVDLLLRPNTFQYEDVGNGGIYTLTWGEGNDALSLEFPAFLDVNEGHDGAPSYIHFASLSDLENGLVAYYSGNENFCNRYSADIVAPQPDDPNVRPFQTSLVCNFYDGENPSTELTVDLGDGVLPNEDHFDFEITRKNQPNFWEVEFENTKSISDNQDYVIVTSRDQSLAGKEFKIELLGGIVGCMGDENGTRCTEQLTSNPFTNDSNASWIISGVGFDLDPEAIQITVRGPEGFSAVPEITKVGSNYTFNLRGIQSSWTGVSFAVEEPHEGGGGGEPERPPHPGVATNGKVTVTDAGASNDSKSFYLGRVEINQTPIFENEDCEWNSDGCPETYVNNNLTYNKEENVNTVEISFAALFIFKYVGTITINGQTYNIPVDYSDRQSWLAHYGYQCVGFTFDDVPYAEEYAISYSVAEAEGHEQYVGNFLWTTDPREEFDDQGRPSDIYIGHSHLEVVEVLCHITDNDADDVRFSVENGEDAPEGCVFEYTPDDDKNPIGSLVVPEGSEVTVRLKTEYGYQVTSFGSNGSEIKPEEGKIAQYTFGIFRGNFHLGAIVEATSDEVNIDTKSIKSGTITLGGDEIDEGTAMLTVEDIKLSDEEKAQFQDEAGDYDVKTYLNIDLDQIFYDGHGSYWKGATMRELDNEATIAFKLADDIDGNQIVLVHQKHDGSYEIIPTEYDAKTHTISFKTSSFSNYAIATKTVAEVASPNTGDDLIQYVALFTVSSMMLAVIAAASFATKKEA